jgi:adenylyl-sulfate kinase
MNETFFIPPEYSTGTLQRMKLLQQQPLVLWMTGLSGSGKSTLAVLLDKELSSSGYKTYLLDGDILRKGLNKDLGFSDADRHENIRRTGEVCKILFDAGLVVITAFISPFRKDRDMVRSLFPEGRFIEIYINTPLAVCEKRDVKGLYTKARAGIIPDFTGIGSAYEAPLNAELKIATENKTPEESLASIKNYVLPQLKYQNKS